MSEEHQRHEPETGQPEAITVPQQANAETGGEADSAGRSTQRILILEDEAWDAELAQRLLSQRGRGLRRRRRRHQGVVCRAAGRLPARHNPVRLPPARLLRPGGSQDRSGTLPGHTVHHLVRCARRRSSGRAYQAGGHRLRAEGPARPPALGHHARAGRGQSNGRGWPSSKTSCCRPSAWPASAS